jgi:oligopeptide transport system ATP-binding protein
MRKVRGKQIAMIFQDPMTSLNPVLTIGRQITESLQLHLRMSPRQAHTRAVELLQLVGIPSAARRVDDYPHQFSGGMRQRAMIAMALSCNPNLLIADEPTTALDVTIQAQILELIANLRQEFNTAVLLITHDMGVVAGVADRIVVMYAGKVAETSQTEELFGNPRHPYTLGLLNSIPRLDETRRERLVPIEGLPPDLINLPAVCSFSARCSFALERCLQGVPELRTVAPNHQAACIREITQSALSMVAPA